MTVNSSVGTGEVEAALPEVGLAIVLLEEVEEIDRRAEVGGEEPQKPFEALVKAKRGTKQATRLRTAMLTLGAGYLNKHASGPRQASHTMGKGLLTCKPLSNTDSCTPAHSADSRLRVMFLVEKEEEKIDSLSFPLCSLKR